MNQKKEIQKLGHGGVRSLIKRALELGIEITFLQYEQKLIKLTFNKKSVFITKGNIPIKKRLGDMTRNKNLTKLVLGEVGIKSPRGIVVTSSSEAISLLGKNNLTYPLITKLLKGSLARGVTWNIDSEHKLKEAIALLKKNNTEEKILVEEMFTGDEFRVLVFDKKVISCVKKIPASLIGNGKSTIKELVASFNMKRKKGFKIKIDTVVKNTLQKNKLTLASILPKNFTLKLRNNLNMSDGGRSVEFTKEMHPRFKKICEKAIEVLGLTFGGIDFMTKNISASKNSYVILEVNPNPFYNMHEKPLVEGQGVDVSSKILKELFPDLK